MNLISLINASKSFGIRNLFQGLTLHINGKERLGLIGPNGAGKTTAIGIITSLVNKTSGSIQVFDSDIDHQLSLAKSYLGVVPQEINLNLFDKCINTLVNQAGFYGIPRSEAKKRAEDYLKQMNLWDKRNSNARDLSGGMKRRLMVARALVNKPKLLLLDEPTAGVDIETRRMMWNFLRELNEQGTTIILTTHYLEEAERLCDYITIINKGKILVNDRKEALLNLITTRKVNFELNKTISKIPEELEQFSPECNNLILKISYNKNKNKISDIIKILNLNNITFNEIKTFDEDLESVFIKITKESI